MFNLGPLMDGVPEPSASLSSQFHTSTTSNCTENHMNGAPQLCSIIFLPLLPSPICPPPTLSAELSLAGLCVWSPDAGHWRSQASAVDLSMTEMQTVAIKNDPLPPRLSAVNNFAPGLHMREQPDIYRGPLAACSALIRLTALGADGPGSSEWSISLRTVPPAACYWKNGSFGSAPSS